MGRRSMNHKYVHKIKILIEQNKIIYYLDENGRLKNFNPPSNKKKSFTIEFNNVHSPELFEEVEKSLSENFCWELNLSPIENDNFDSYSQEKIMKKRRSNFL